MIEQTRYSAKWIRFVQLKNHAEAFRMAYVDQSIASRNELERLAREYATLPPRHAGWCPGECPSERCGLLDSLCAKRGHFHSACLECRRLRSLFDWSELHNEREVDYGGHPVLTGVVPNTTILDLERAIAALGERESAANVANWLNG